MLNCFNREKVTWVQIPGNTHNFFSGSFKFIIDMENTHKVLVVYLCYVKVIGMVPLNQVGKKLLYLFS